MPPEIDLSTTPFRASRRRRILLAGVGVVLVGIGAVVVDGNSVDPAAITATRSGDATVHRAVDVSRSAPVSFGKGDVVTFHIAGHRLAPGKHRFEVEVFERNLGSLQLQLRDTVKGSPSG